MQAVQSAMLYGTHRLHAGVGLPTMQRSPGKRIKRAVSMLVRGFFCSFFNDVTVMSLH